MEFKVRDGVCLYMEKHLVDNPKSTIIIVHGLGENQGRYEWVTKQLNSNGYSVYRYDHRGHGRSGCKRGYAKHFSVIINDLDEIVDYVKKEEKTDVYLLGHSMGGFIVNNYGSHHSDKLKGIISSAAPGIILNMVKILSKVPFKLIGWVNYKNALGGALSHDPQVPVDYESDPYNLKKFKIRLLGTMFIEGVRDLQANIKNFNCPVLYLHGTGDEIVEYQSTEWLYANNPTTDKSKVLYDGMYHEILNEVEKAKVMNDILDWLNNR